MSEQNRDAAHAATATRLDRARRDGDVARSRELVSAIQLCAIVLAMYWLFSMLISTATEFTTNLWSSELNYSFGASDLQQQLVTASTALAQMLLPFLGIVLIAVVVSNWSQTGSMFLPGKVVPDVGRLSPADWFKRLFSGPSFVRAVFGLPKFMVVLATATLVLWVRRTELVMLSGLEIESLIPAMSNLVFCVAGWIAATLLVISSLDYALERVDHATRLRMSDRELRDEQRMQNVDPIVTNRRRQIHREMRG